VAGAAGRVPRGREVLTFASRFGALVVAMGAALAVVAPQPALAGEDPPIVVTPGPDGIGTVVTQPGKPGRPPESGAGTPCGAECQAAAAACAQQGFIGCASTTLGAPTPGQLAIVAYGRLPLPTPAVRRSPSEALRYQGLPYSYVNLWTWYWTEPGTFRTVSQTVTAGGVSATVTARPVELRFDPGDGNPAVTCPGPGRPWRQADGNSAPESGCGYRYRHVSSSGPVTATVSTVWRVTWVGNNGTSGSLPLLMTQASDRLNVIQTQTVNP